MLMTLASAAGTNSMWSHLFAFDVPPAEKILRTVVVYLAIAVILRLAGKRQMAQLNTFDLVVVLLLSNVVQNAIIGPDNSVIGGVLGAVVLVGFNAIIERLSTMNAFTSRLFEGSASTLVTRGQIIERTVRRAGLRDPEVLAALRHQGADELAQVQRAALEPSGTLTVELEPEARAVTQGDLKQAVVDLQRHLDARLDALSAREA